MKTYNIMELVEGKKYKDQEGYIWKVDECGQVVKNSGIDITEEYTSQGIRKMVFTEVKEPITFYEAMEIMNNGGNVRSEFFNLDIYIDDNNFRFKELKELFNLSIRMINGKWYKVD